MQEQPTGQHEESKKFRDWIPVLWSYEALMMYTGLALGAVAAFRLAKPFLENGHLAEGLLFTATAVGLCIMPVAAITNLHRESIKDWRKSKSNRKACPCYAKTSR